MNNKKYTVINKHFTFNKHFMIPAIFALCICFLAVFSMLGFSATSSHKHSVHKTTTVTSSHKKLYDELALKKMNLSYKVFDYAMKGYSEINPPKKKYLVIQDYTQPSDNKRFYLINLADKKVEFNGYVAHGKNTGALMADHFSNVNGSKKTSLGFYLTGNPYYGSNGYSLRLKGLEKGINNNAMKRHIVMHGADYVSKAFIDKHGRIGRSWGCPAINNKDAKRVINKIKDGTLILSYSNKANYLSRSQFNNYASDNALDKRLAIF